MNFPHPNRSRLNYTKNRKLCKNKAFHKSQFRRLSLRVRRSNLAFLHEIAAPACRYVRLTHPSQAGTSACRHAPFPALGGARNDRMEKGIRHPNWNLGISFERNVRFYVLQIFLKLHLEVMCSFSILLNRSSSMGRLFGTSMRRDCMSLMLPLM